MGNYQNTFISGASKPPSALFDVQATSYDRRVGIPEDCRDRIVEAILWLSGLQPGELLVEVGAGTGQIGAGLARSPIGYLGFDISGEMLAVFRDRLGNIPTEGAELVQADGNQPWPVADGSAKAIFSSRAIHLLDADAVLRECDRVSHPQGAVLLIGRVQRSPDSIKAQMQRQMRQGLRDLGRSPRDGAKTKERLLQHCGDRGGQRLEPTIAARWTREYSPRRSLESWYGKPGLGGIESLPDTEKRAVLQNLSQWAIATYGDLNFSRTEEETYCLEGVRLPKLEG